jgi:hypothetical protein
LENKTDFKAFRCAFSFLQEKNLRKPKQLNACVISSIVPITSLPLFSVPSCTASVSREKRFECKHPTPGAPYLYSVAACPVLWTLVQVLTGDPGALPDLISTVALISSQVHRQGN